MLTREIIDNASENFDPNIRTELIGDLLWQKFFISWNEMIVTRSGRKMFPVIKFAVEGLEPQSMYTFVLQFQQISLHRWRYLNGQWNTGGRPELAPDKNFYSHEDSPNFGSHWMERHVSFGKLKLSNKETQPHQVTELKIRHNPFAKAFLEAKQRNGRFAKNLYSESSDQNRALSNQPNFSGNYSNSGANPDYGHQQMMNMQPVNQAVMTRLALCGRFSPYNTYSPYAFPNPNNSRIAAPVIPNSSSLSNFHYQSDNNVAAENWQYERKDQHSTLPYPNSQQQWSNSFSHFGDLGQSIVNEISTRPLTPSYNDRFTSPLQSTGNMDVQQFPLNPFCSTSQESSNFCLTSSKPGTESHDDTQLDVKPLSVNCRSYNRNSVRNPPNDSSSYGLSSRYTTTSPTDSQRQLGHFYSLYSNPPHHASVSHQNDDSQVQNCFCAGNSGCNRTSDETRFRYEHQR